MWTADGRTQAYDLAEELGLRAVFVTYWSAAAHTALDIADCRLVFDEAVYGVWAGDHFESSPSHGARPSTRVLRMTGFSRWKIRGRAEQPVVDRPTVGWS